MALHCPRRAVKDMRHLVDRQVSEVVEKDDGTQLAGKAPDEVAHRRRLLAIADNRQVA